MEKQSKAVFIKEKGDKWGYSKWQMRKYIFKIDETDKNYWHIKIAQIAVGPHLAPAPGMQGALPGKGQVWVPLFLYWACTGPSGVIHMLKFQPLRWWYEVVGSVDVIKSEAEPSRQKSALAKEAWERASSLLTGGSALKTILLWSRKWSLSSHGICIHLDPGLLSTSNC